MASSETFSKIEIINEQIYFAKAKFDDWLDLPDRFKKKKVNIIKYATKTEKNWLNLSKNHALDSYLTTVDVALIDGQYYKITGLIRAGLWESGALERPRSLNALCLCIRSSLV